MTNNEAIEDHQILQMIIESYPQSWNYLVKNVEDWLPEKGPITPCSILRHISHLVKEEFLKDEYDHSKELFKLIEDFIVRGSENVANAACTCFIENLQNYCGGSDGFEPNHFVSLLGPKSIDYAKEWDEFTGVKTEGLY